MTTDAPLYIRRPDESLQDFIVRIKESGRLPELVEEPGPSTGKSAGRPRSDDAILAALQTDAWTPLSVIVTRMGKGYEAVRRALYVASTRGLVERQPGLGWRIRSQS
jgi:hypothetical protein